MPLVLVSLLHVPSNRLSAPTLEQFLFYSAISDESEELMIAPESAFTKST